MLSTNIPLPAFSVVDDTGATVTNDSITGHWTILYFYPKDDTTGCTTQACSIRDSSAALTKQGIHVYGISADSVKSHGKFKEKYHLHFPLLVDADHAMALAFDVWVEKSMYGKKYMGMERSTYVINPVGIIVGAYQKVNPTDHGEFLLAEMAKLMAA